MYKSLLKVKWCTFLVLLSTNYFLPMFQRLKYGRITIDNKKLKSIYLYKLSGTNACIPQSTKVCPH